LLITYNDKGDDIHKGHTKWHKEKHYFSLGQKKPGAFRFCLLMFVLRKNFNKENSNLSQKAHTKGIGKKIIFP
jgi:hypothetical protein